MQDMDQNKTTEFVIEKMKERPVSRKKLLRRTIITAFMAVMFGLIACITFLILEPVISNLLYPQEEPGIVIFPEDQEEMAPEEMLSDNLPAEKTPSPSKTPLFPNVPQEEEIQDLLSYITLDVEQYEQLHEALAEMVRELNHCMVTVSAIQSNADWLGNATNSEKQGVGIIIGNNGKELLVLTNYGFLKDADSMEITFWEDDTVSAQMKQKHVESDIAILSVNTALLGNKLKGINIASFGSSSTKQLLCTPVVALGNPYGEFGSVGYGMITSDSKCISVADGNYKLLVTDIYGSQNASGFLFNMRGQVIGMITTKKTPTEMRNLITAYGISDLRKLISNLSKGSSVAYIGIIGTEITDEVNLKGLVPKGVYIEEIEMDSPAMKAGILRGDIIVGINNTVVNQFSDYFQILTGMEAGNTVKLKIMRPYQDEYTKMEFDIVLEEAE